MLISSDILCICLFLIYGRVFLYRIASINFVIKASFGLGSSAVWSPLYSFWGGQSSTWKYKTFSLLAPCARVLASDLLSYGDSSPTHLQFTTLGPVIRTCIVLLRLQYCGVGVCHFRGLRSRSKRQPSLSTGLALYRTSTSLRTRWVRYVAALPPNSVGASH